MTKKLSSLSWKLKLITTYLYLILIGNIAGVIIIPFVPDQVLGLSNPNFGRVATIISSLIIAILITWTLSRIHTRSKDTVFAYAIMTITSYGTYASLYNGAGSSAQPVASILLSVALLIIDISIAIFLFKSSEAKQQLNKA